MAKIKKSSKTEKKNKKDTTFKTKHYPCSYCSKTFSERAGRDHHLQLHSSERPFSCSLCPHTCKTKKYLAKHVRVVHNPPTSFKCEYCDKMFHYKCILDKHIVVHTNSRPHKCKECGKGFNSQYSLRSHTLIHKNLKPFKCQFCEYACRDSSTLRKHQERHMGIVRRYECTICEKRFSKKDLLQCHVAEIHMNLNLKKIQCDQCDKMFRTKRQLNIHVEVKHNRKFATTCEICGLKLSNKYNMNSHLLSHVNAKPYKCAFSGCDKRYKDRSTLQKHSIIHYPEKQFPCKTCGRKFTRKERLKKHKKQHVARVRNVQCDYCGVCFYNKNYLSVHIHKKHSRIKRKFICDMCDFESGNKPGLIKHLKGHNMRMDKQCPICLKRYKQVNWLRLHLWQAHNVMEENGTPTFEMDIKVEPIDLDGTPEFELFEIEKEEILDELHSNNKETNPDLINATETVAAPCIEIQKYNGNFLLNTKATDDLTSVNVVAQFKQPIQATVTENNDVHRAEHSSVFSQNDNTPKGTENKCRKEVMPVSENSTICGRTSLDELADIDNIQEAVHSEVNVVGNIDNDRSNRHSNSLQLEDNDNLYDSVNVLSKNQNVCQNVADHHTKTILEQDDGPKVEEYSKAALLQEKQLNELKRNSGKIHKDHISKGNSLAHIKTKILNRKRQGVNKKIKYFSDINKKLHNSKPKSVTHIKVALLDKQQSENNKRINSESLSESEEMNETYSKEILSEDVTRWLTLGQKKNPAEKNLDEFFIEHIVNRREKSNDKVLEIDKDCETYAKNYVDKLLKKSRNNREVKLIEKTRQQYNERIKKARKICPEKVLIRYFDKTTRNEIKTCNKDDGNESQETERNGIKSDAEQLNQDKCDNIANIFNDCDNTIQEKNIYSNYDNDKEETQSSSYSNNTEINHNDNEQTQSRACPMDGKREKESNRIHLRSISGSKKRYGDDGVLDNGQIKSDDEFRKIKLNTHQCYVCFKLFGSKEELLDHCKHHFDVCNTTILKKCPLCDFATNLNIVQHMKVEHDVEITIPSPKIINKQSENGPGYCYKVNSATITDIDVIPSVKHLNKQAYIAIDKKNRKLKDTGIAKTKLVKKGNEWIVERKTTNIDNVDEFILPEFNVDEILSIKIDSNDYLTRMKKLSRLAKKHKKQMLFPCESCDKICQTLSALKLHYRRHDPMSKPFKKKVWKHKLKDLIQPSKKKNAYINCGKEKHSRVVEVDKYDTTDNIITDNRYKKPKPVVNKHKCDPELIKFYETNIKGGDIEFWQFLKIFNKMSRENVNDFDDLNERPEFGIHPADHVKVNDNAKEGKFKDNEKVDNNKNVRTIPKNISTRHRFKITTQNRYKRIIRISKRDYQRRNVLKQTLREKFAKENVGLTTNI